MTVISVLVRDCKQFLASLEWQINQSSRNLNTLREKSKYGPEKTPYLDTFHAVNNYNFPSAYRDTSSLNEIDKIKESNKNAKNTIIEHLNINSFRKMFIFTEEIILMLDLFLLCKSKLVLFETTFLTLSAPRISENCINIKINVNFYFHTSLLCLKWFYDGLYLCEHVPCKLLSGYSKYLFLNSSKAIISGYF